MTTPAADPDDRDRKPGVTPGQSGGNVGPVEGGDDASVDPDQPSLQDWVEAENSRPTLPDETADGLDDMDEEVRHQAEDLPLDTPGRL